MDSLFFGFTSIPEIFKGYLEKKDIEDLLLFFKAVNFRKKVKAMGLFSSLYAFDNFYRYRILDDEKKVKDDWILVEKNIGLKVLSNVKKIKESSIAEALDTALRIEFCNWMYNDYIPYDEEIMDDYGYRKCIKKFIKYIESKNKNKEHFDRFLIYNIFLKQNDENVIYEVFSLPLEKLPHSYTEQIREEMERLRKIIEGAVAGKEVPLKTPPLTKAGLAKRMGWHRSLFLRGEWRKLWNEYKYLNRGDEVAEIPYLDLYKLVQKSRISFEMNINDIDDLRRLIL